jgi:hypothetical protein
MVFACLLICLFGFSYGKQPPDFGIISQNQQPPKPPAERFQIAAAASKIKVDGVLDEEAWAQAARIKLIYEWTPGDNVPPPVETDCLVTFDKNFFYVAFRAKDPEPGKIRAHLMDRDDTDRLIQDDHISIIIDPFNDERRGFQFRVNPLGVQADANFSESEGYEDFSWDAIWSSAGKVSEWGYAIELAIPFQQLRFPKTEDVQTWGFSAERSWPRNVRHRITSHRRDRNVACILCQVNKISGIQGITPGRNIELDPTLTASRTDERQDFPSGPIASGKVNAEPGLTARWGITPNLVLNGALNPDFSQVEADVAQLDVNVRFALYYPEKRPFFLEGADFFLTPFEAVFTRTVADPAGGVKLTGKSGKNALGFFMTYDRINNLLFPSNQGSASAFLDDDVGGGVFRFRRDMGRNSTLGVLYTGRNSKDYYNHTGGLDGFFWLSQTKSLRFQYLHSETRYPEGISSLFGQKQAAFGGEAFTAQFLHFGRDWRFQLEYEDLSPGFRADSGFIPRVDVRNVEGNLGKIFWGKGGDWFTQIVLGVDGEVVYDHDGRLTDREIGLGGSYQGPWQTIVNGHFSMNKELYLGELYDLTQFQFYSESKPAGGVQFSLMGFLGDGIDYSNGRKANGTMLMPSTALNITRHLNFSLSHAFERLGFEGREIYTANLTQLRGIYNFNVRTFFRVIVQYRHVTRNPALYSFPVQSRSSAVFSQLLFSYKINPQTVLFVGYSDNYLSFQGIELSQTDRTFFLKIGYAWTE